MTQKERSRLLSKIIDELIVMDDGYYYWFPRRNGGLSAATLRGIADIVDEMNRKWDEEVDRELMKEGL